MTYEVFDANTGEVLGTYCHVAFSLIERDCDEYLEEGYAADIRGPLEL
jgi:hypothetical protein